MVEKDLESGWSTVLSAGLQRLDLAAVLLSFKIEVDRESIKHKLYFKLFL
jgi:hypothetical protein